MITVNVKSLSTHLDHEKTKEIRVELHISTSKHAIYRKTDHQVTVRGRSKKAKVTSTKEDIFMHFVDSLPKDVCMKFIDAHPFKQGRIWRAWNDMSVTSTDDAISQLESLIKQVV